LPLGGAREPLPPELIGEITKKSNLIAYGWELTGERLKQWRSFFQLWQLLFHPGIANAGTPAHKWIDALSTKLGNAGTEVTLTAPDEVTVVRNSATGFTAVELSCLAYWLDSPGFPLSAYKDPPQWHSDAGTPLLPPPAPARQP
jgi:hypothetical protein